VHASWVSAFAALEGLPEPERRLHDLGVGVVDRFERDGSPFALLLRTWMVRQLFGESDLSGRFWFENHVFDELAHIGVGTVQVREPDSPFPNVDAEGEPVAGADADPAIDPEPVLEFTVRTPSLSLNERWFEAVTRLVERAELIAMYLPVATPGVVDELEAIVESGRADRTVVLYSTSYAVEPLPEVPLLPNFERIARIDELDHRRPIASFVFEDLVERLRSLARIPPARRLRLLRKGDLDRTYPVTWTGVSRGFEAAATAHRGRGDNESAATALDRAARVAMMRGDVDTAVRQRKEQATVLRELNRLDAAEEVVATQAAALDHVTVRDQSHLAFLNAEMTIARAQITVARGNAVEGKQMLEAEHSRCELRGDTRAQAALLVALAWITRNEGDVFAALDAAHRAVALARAAGAALELARAQLVLGVLWYDVREPPAAADALSQAANVLPQGVEGDLCLILVKLGDIAAASGRAQEARRAFAAAWKLADELGSRAQAVAAGRRLADLVPEPD